MLHHVILWKLKENTNKEEVKNEIKIGLEGLKDKIPGIISIEVITENMNDSCDLMLDSYFETKEDYVIYKDHPEHLKVANGVVRPNVDIRLCMDYQK